MKKKIITLVAFAVLSFTATFAASNDISKDARRTFSETFAKATDVKWEKFDTYYSAAFVLNGQAFNALLSEDGDMIAVSRNILSTELPTDLKAALPPVFAASWIADLVKYTIGDETKYYLTIENADEKIILESIGNLDWSLLKRTNKA